MRAPRRVPAFVAKDRYQSALRREAPLLELAVLRREWEMAVHDALLSYANYQRLN